MKLHIEGGTLARLETEQHRNLRQDVLRYTPQKPPGIIMALAFGPSAKGGVDNLHTNGRGVVAIDETGCGFVGMFVDLQSCSNVLDGVIGLLQYRDHGYSLPYMRLSAHTSPARLTDEDLRDSFRSLTHVKPSARRAGTLPCSVLPGSSAPPRTPRW